MRNRRGVRSRRWISVALVATLAIAACNSGDESSVPQAEASAAGWALYGHDLSNTRYNAGETEITGRSVRSLTADWSKSGLVGVTGTPAVVDGVAYFGDWTGAVWAVDALSGAELWTTSIGGMIASAVAVEPDAVYAAAGRMLHRLDRATGAVEWQTETNEHPLGQISASPVVVDGLVLQGTASAELVIPQADYTFRGTIGAYDVTTGREVWRFYTTAIDADGGAGVGVWSTPAVDRERGVLYVGSGNTYTEPTARLADSILAIDYRTGELRWSTQFTNPDVFSAANPQGKDADVGASPNLWTSDGRDLVGAGDKAGVYHALDRETGEIVWQTTLTPGSVFGGEIGSGALVDDSLVVVSNIGDPATNSPTNAAKAFALDPATGGLIWETPEYEGLIFAPVGAVPGVAFVGTNEGKLVALDVDSGEELWSYDAPDKTGCGPSIVDGRVLWGYGYTLFQGPGDGGVISFALPE